MKIVLMLLVSFQVIAIGIQLHYPHHTSPKRKVQVEIQVLFCFYFIFIKFYFLFSSCSLINFQFKILTYQIFLSPYFGHHFLKYLKNSQRLKEISDIDQLLNACRVHIPRTVYEHCTESFVHCFHCLFMYSRFLPWETLFS